MDGEKLIQQMHTGGKNEVLIRYVTVTWQS